VGVGCAVSFEGFFGAAGDGEGAVLQAQRERGLLGVQGGLDAYVPAVGVGWGAEGVDGAAAGADQAAATCLARLSWSRSVKIVQVMAPAGMPQSFVVEASDLSGADVVRAFDGDGSELWRADTGGTVMRLSDTTQGGAVTAVITNVGTSFLRAFWSDVTATEIPGSNLKGFAIDPRNRFLKRSQLVIVTYGRTGSLTVGQPNFSPPHDVDIPMLDEVPHGPEAPSDLLHPLPPLPACMWPWTP
jgi:hypothetical protein